MNDSDKDGRAVFSIILDSKVFFFCVVQNNWITIMAAKLVYSPTIEFFEDTSRDCFHQMKILFDKSVHYTACMYFNNIMNVMCDVMCDVVMTVIF